jgi:hypothetical protein
MDLLPGLVLNLHVHIAGWSRIFICIYEMCSPKRVNFSFKITQAIISKVEESFVSRVGNRGYFLCFKKDMDRLFIFPRLNINNIQLIKVLLVYIEV